jgi:hypothetical protein
MLNGEGAHVGYGGSGCDASALNLNLLSVMVFFLQILSIIVSGGAVVMVYTLS